MIQPAQLYTTELKVKFWEIAYEDKYMFANDGYIDDYKPSDSTWNGHEFVSVDKENNLLGYIRYYINQRTNNCSGLCVTNFGDSITFARDLFKIIDDIFCKYKFNKLKYGVFIGNPIEKTYDKLTKKYGGRVIGIAEKDSKLLDGNYYDYKSYEIHREDYLKNRKKHM